MFRMIKIQSFRRVLFFMLLLIGILSNVFAEDDFGNITPESGMMFERVPKNWTGV